MPYIVVCITVAIAILTAFLLPLICCRPKLYFSASYYFVYYKLQFDAYSASSISSTVQSYGGAGYVLQSGEKYYITVACYYSQEDAQSVCENLKKQGLDCEVLCASVESYDLPTRNSVNNGNTYLGTLNTLDSLSHICYETANSIDAGDCDQAKAKTVLQDLRATLNGLLRADGTNCFTQEINYLITLCDDACFDYIYSKNIRALQVAIADCILNVQLY